MKLFLIKRSTKWFRDTYFIVRAEDEDLAKETLITGAYKGWEDSEEFETRIIEELTQEGPIGVVFEVEEASE